MSIKLKNFVQCSKWEVTSAIDFKYICKARSRKFYLFYFKLLKSLKNSLIYLFILIFIQSWYILPGKHLGCKGITFIHQDFHIIGLYMEYAVWAHHSQTVKPPNLQSIASRYSAIWICSKPVGFIVKAEITTQHLQSRSNHFIGHC